MAERNISKDFIARINLKPSTADRKKLIDFCLTKDKEHQYLAIGWSSVYPSDEPFDNVKIYCQKVRDYAKRNNKRTNTVIKLFEKTVKDDLFWTRDADGCYWICRATGQAESMCRKELDIGAVIPVKAYKCGLEVLGQIKASFNRPNGGTAERIKDKCAIEYSKEKYNKLSGEDYYIVNHNIQDDFLGCLPAGELEELVITYIQITENLYVLSNSIANKSTTPKIECEFGSREAKKPIKAVVQVKAGDRVLIASDYGEYVRDGYRVYLYASGYKKDLDTDKITYIGREELLDFVEKYESVLPRNIMQFKNIFDV